METEFNLSDKIWNDINDIYEDEALMDCIPIEDVKEFIRLLKKEIDGLDFFMSGSKLRFDDWLKAEIDKLAGDKLI